MLSEQQPTAQTCSSRRFADIARGLFFVLATVSMIVVMIMFIRVWQPIWESGFKDFHTISSAIDNLNETARPASETVPLMLEQMTQMNHSMQEMKTVMLDMRTSMQQLEQLTPRIEHMDGSIEHMNVSLDTMTVTLSTQMSRMSYLIAKIKNKFSPTGMMPFNW
jgi:uncharacterized protein YoxC